MAAQERTVANNIRETIHSRLSSVKDEKISSHASTLNRLPDRERNSRILRAATAINRATTDNSYRPSPDHVRDYAAAVELIAQKRGIKPSEDGRFSQEQLQTVLSPQEVLRSAASEYLRSSNDKDKAQEEIETNIKSVYSDDETKAEPVVSSVKNVPSYITDSEFQELDAAAQQEYMSAMGGAEQDRLQHLISQKAQETDEDILKKTGEYEGNMPDPDWGHKKDDDDFKIEQGDIIEYLMKDIILASAAWAGNKTAGLVGIVGYEIGAGMVRSARPYVKQAGKEAQKEWENLKDTVKEAVFGDKKKKAQSEEEKRQIEEQEAALDHFFDTYSENVEAAKKAGKNFSQTNQQTEAFNKLQRQLIKHYVVFEDKELIFPTIENADPKTCLTHAKYEDFAGENGGDKLKSDLRQIQKNFDEYQISEMIRVLGVPESERAAVKQWFEQKSKLLEDSVRQNKRTNKNPTPRNRQYEAAYKKAQKAALTKLHFHPEIQLLQAQQQQFVAHYSAFLLFNELHKNPNSNLLAKDENGNYTNYNEFMKKATREAQVLFLTAEQKRRSGQDIPSRDQMISDAEKLVTEAKKALEKKENTTPIEDTLKRSIAPSTDSNEQRTLIDAAKNMTVDTLLTNQLADYDQRLKELRSAQGNNDAKIKMINDLKRRTDGRVKDTQTGPNKSQFAKPKDVRVK